MSSPFGSALLGVSTFCASQHTTDACDSRGLPLTPNSIRIYGRFRSKLRTLSHRNLCAYLDIHRLRNERLLVVSEYYNDSLEEHIKTGRFSNKLGNVASDILHALAYLNERGLTHRFLCPPNVLVTPEGSLKLQNHGLYHMTGGGADVNFPITSPRYMSPELILTPPTAAFHGGSPKVDVWALGIILLELFMGKHLFPDLFMKNAVSTVFQRIIILHQRKSSTPLSILLNTHQCEDKLMDPELRSFLEACLTTVPSHRPSPEALLNHAVLATVSKEPIPNKNGYQFLCNPFKSSLRRTPLLETTPLSIVDTPPPLEGVECLAERSLEEVYYLWCLAGGDVEKEMKKHGLIHPKPPICGLPSLVIQGGDTYGITSDRVALYDGTVVILPLDQLKKRLEHLTVPDYYPLMESTGELNSQGPSHETSKLPLVIKEKDVEYQLHRMVLFARLLEGYPYMHHMILREAVTDVCPLVRAEVWAAVLGVKGDIHSEYSAIDKDSPHSMDRQISVDVPRCHQYHPLLSSPEGHTKLKRLLKSWVVTNTQLVYWQGLDSLCAPFLTLNFDNEALAFASVNAFISKYLHKFFLKDNSPIMQEYLALFSHLIAFHDPELYMHLDSIGFNPELYAIPWFLTMFTHVLPMNKIYHIWDTLLLGNCSFPLFVGLAILHQLRADLLSYSFNDCILTFSDLPDVDIQLCIQDSIHFFRVTPPSAYFREHEPIPTQPGSIPLETRRESIPLSTLRSEYCPQISAHDMILLCGLEAQLASYSQQSVEQMDRDFAASNPLFGQTVTQKKRRQHKGLVVDIRSVEEFQLGHVPNSVNLPNNETFMADGSFIPSPATSTLLESKGKTLVIVSGRGEGSAKFAGQLIRMHFPRVCVLQGGAGMLRSLGLLCSLNNDP
ncbi:hypothetical protein EMCRGX_G024018 [Ephydatia muelleri]